MTDYQSFKHGAVQFPLPAMGSGVGGIGGSLLRDADPPIYYALEFFAAALRTHLEQRFLAEADACGADHITAIVKETLPLNPEPYLNEEQIGFPLLAVYRKSGKFQYFGQDKNEVSEIDVAFVLPPLQVGEAERLMPILKAVAAVIDNRTEQGCDPSYTPTAPTGTAGDHVWERAGVSVAEVKMASFGGYTGIKDQYFPAVVLSLELKEISGPAVTEFEDYDGADVDVQLDDPALPPLVDDFIDLSID